MAVARNHSGPNEIKLHHTQHLLIFNADNSGFGTDRFVYIWAVGYINMSLSVLIRIKEIMF